MRIGIQYGRRFSRFAFENDTGVTLVIDNGAEDQAGIFLGADDTHCKVRQYHLPDVIRACSGMLGVTYAFDKSKIRFSSAPLDCPLPATTSGKVGGFVMASQNVEANEMFAGRRFRYPRQSRAGWDALMENKSELISMVQSEMDQWSDTVQSCLKQTSSPNVHYLSIWPLHVVPKLES